jgi:hypothetical protein
MNSVRKQGKAFRRFATIMAALVVLASSAASERADSSSAASSRSIATSHAGKKSSGPKALPSAGPSPGNLLAVGQYPTNDRGTDASLQEVAVGDFNQDGYQDVVVDQSTCVTFMPGVIRRRSVSLLTIDQNGLASKYLISTTRTQVSPHI